MCGNFDFALKMIEHFFSEPKTMNEFFELISILNTWGKKRSKLLIVCYLQIRCFSVKEVGFEEKVLAHSMPTQGQA